MHKKMMKKIFLIILVLIAFTQIAEAKFNIFAYSREAPKTKIFDLEGRAVSLHDFKNDFLVVVFWSKTCIPCLREMKDLSRFVDKVKNDGIKVILVSPEKEWTSKAEQAMILKKYGGEKLDVYLDRKSDLGNEFGIFTSPHSVLIDENSMEIGRVRGAIDWDDEDVIEYIYKLKAQD